MRALVVYESMFGNTRTVAEAIGEGIAAHMPVEVVEVASAPTAIPADVALLVVGGPTHAHGQTNVKTRADAAQRAGDRLVSHGDGIREWLEVVRPLGGPVSAAAFDTRIKGPELLWGSAAKAAAIELGERGLRVIDKPHSFLVGGPTGPLFDRLIAGQRERAVEWGASLAAGLAVPAGAR
jgi:hypothetical protein